MRLYSPVLLATLALVHAGALAAAIHQSLAVFSPTEAAGLLDFYTASDAAGLHLWRLVFFAVYWLLAATSGLWFMRLVRANRAFKAKRRALGLTDDSAP